MTVLSREFYLQEDVVEFAKQLLGKWLMTHIDGKLTGGMIIETEAYKGAEDRACHAYNNRRTKRTEVMFQEGGLSYVYLCYGMHHLFNIVTNKKNVPHAILIRALDPKIGLKTMQERRKTKKNLTNGPGLVCKALGINRTHYGHCLEKAPIWIEDQKEIIQTIIAKPRVGVSYAKEDALLPWRFLVDKQ